MTKYIKNKFLIAIATTFLASACVEPAQKIPSPSDELCPVKLSIDNNALNPQQDLIAIQIYQHTKTGKFAYAYGLFDTYEIPAIMLTNNVEYSFAATTVVDAKNKIYATTTDEITQYYPPFGFSLHNPTSLDNKFYVSTNLFSLIARGLAVVNQGDDKKIYSHPQIQRYMGVSETFSPQATPEVNIQLKKVYTTLNITANNLKQGSLTFDIDDSAPIILTKDQPQKQIDISLEGSLTNANQWLKDGYSESVEYSIYYTAPSDEIIYFANKEKLKLTRNTIQPITINITSSSSITLSIESEEETVLEEITIEGTI